MLKHSGFARFYFKNKKNINSWQQKQIDAGGVNKAIEKIEEYIVNCQKI